MTLHAPNFRLPDCSDRPLNVEVIGIDPKNQGAQLMLLTILQELQGRLPNVRIGVDVSMPFEDRIKLGVWGVTPADWHSGWGTKRAKGMLARRFRAQRMRVGLLDSNEIDIVLDASGFAYGDYWGKAKFDHFLTRRLPAWNRNMVCAIAMPQAWGPFSSAAFQHSAEHVLSHFSRVYARDTDSCAHLQNVGVQDVKLAPDFTNMLRVDPTDCPDHWAELGILIPNAKVITGKDQKAHEAYFNFLRQSIATLSRTSRQAAILIHEGSDDMALAKELAVPVEIIATRDPRLTKAILSKSTAVISSRYHGLVSALSSGVPSLACGWTHKYQHLMADYGLGGFSVSLNDAEAMQSTLNRFETAAQLPELRILLHAKAKELRRDTQEMWDDLVKIMLAHVGQHV